MHLHVGMLGQEALNSLGLVCGEVVGDDVALTLFGLAIDHCRQEGHELFTGVSRGGGSDDFSGLGIQSGI